MRRALLLLLALAPAVAAASGGDTSSTATTAVPSAPESPVRLFDRVVFVIRAPREGIPPAERARAAQRALEVAIREPSGAEARVEQQGGAYIVFYGKTPIVQLTEADRIAARDATLAIHAADIAAGVESAVRAERTRSRIANTVFSFSLLVFSALIAFLSIRKIGEVAARVAAWIEASPGRLPSLRVGGVEVISPAAFRGLISVAIGVGTRVAQIAAIYLWLLVAFSLFEATRGLTERLTGMVLTPLSILVGRFVTTLPLALIAAVAAVAVAVLVRTAGLFFGSVSRGETALRWLPQDLAAAAGVLVRLGIIVGALLFVVPLLSPGEESRLTVAVYVALGLAGVPLLATAAAGVLIVFGRRLRVGDHVELGGSAGKVESMSLLEVRLRDATGAELRVPHLLGLIRPARVHAAEPAETALLVLDAAAPQERALELLREAAPGATVELERIDRGGARYRVTGPGAGAAIARAADRLRAEGISLGDGS